ncbi:MAG TPA: hypothetical protein VJZ00_06820 [Thermoanaerobaculia bacterium]|nr:hypothetical protein [Thermoanaerobaculia bacterium]
MLDALVPDPDAEVWDELWGRICHQGTVYSASFAALPILVRTAAQWSPADRFMPLMLAAHILASNDGSPVRASSEPARQEHGRLLADLTRETITAQQWENSRLIQLLAASLVFAGDRFWARELDRIGDGSIEFECPSCNTLLIVSVDRHGVFTSVDDWIHDDPAKRPSILPASSPRAGSQELLLQLATEAHAEEVAGRLLALFGSAECPRCSTLIPIWDEYEKRS